MADWVRRLASSMMGPNAATPNTTVTRKSTCQMTSTDHGLVTTEYVEDVTENGRQTRVRSKVTESHPHPSTGSRGNRGGSSCGHVSGQKEGSSSGHVSAQKEGSSCGHVSGQVEGSSPSPSSTQVERPPPNDFPGQTKNCSLDQGKMKGFSRHGQGQNLRREGTGSHRPHHQPCPDVPNPNIISITASQTGDLSRPGKQKTRVIARMERDSLYKVRKPETASAMLKADAESEKMQMAIAQSILNDLAMKNSQK